MTHKERPSLFFVKVFFSALEEEGGKKSHLSFSPLTLFCMPEDDVFFNDNSTNTQYCFSNRNFRISTFFFQKDIGSLLKEYLISDVSVIHEVL